MSKTIFLLAIMAFFLGCTSPSPDLNLNHEQPREVTASDFTTRVVQFLHKNHRSGSMVYEGNCAEGGVTDSFRVAEPKTGAPAVQALRDAFAQEPRLTVKQDATGRIRVTGGNAHTDLLDLRLPQVTFHDEINPRDATESLDTYAEVQSYMQSHHIKFVNAMNALAPMPKGVHLNATLKNVTISEALDRITKSFPGVWIYGECVTPSGDRFVDFTFIEF